MFHWTRDGEEAEEAAHKPQNLAVVAMVRDTDLPLASLLRQTALQFGSPGKTFLLKDRNLHIAKEYLRTSEKCSQYGI
jgi:hypothetical protein